MKKIWLKYKIYGFMKDLAYCKPVPSSMTNGLGGRCSLRSSYTFVYETSTRRAAVRGICEHFKG